LKPPDILNSKIQKLRIELPHYSFSHSSSGDSPHAFIGRERIKEKLKKVIEDSPDEPGVYLVAGNRGVGKTSLVSQVIKETSFQPKSKFTENLRFLIILVLAVAGTQICLDTINSLTHISDKQPKIFSIVGFLIFLLSFILLCFFNSYRLKITKKITGMRILNGITSGVKELGHLLNYDNPYGKTQYVLKIFLAVSFTQFISFIRFITPIKAFVIYFIIVFVCNLVFHFLGSKMHKKRKISKAQISFPAKIKELFLAPIRNYIKNHNRLYLRINFGHKLKNEKDILRLIARTLSTEYNRFRRSLRRMMFWRIIALGFLLLSASLINPCVRKIMRNLEIVFSTDNKIIITVTDTTIENKVDTKKFAIFDNPLYAFKQFVSGMSEIISGVLGYFWDGNEEIIKSLVFSIDPFFILAFFLMYLFSLLLFRLAWITHLFATHGIVMRQLKKLNSDITYSTERENSIGLNTEKGEPIIGIKTKKSRNIADAREIEKELQDIFDDIQRIPIIMCRPNIVIVFDELDKVEPGVTDSEKENPQTKASMFSIDAARERQTEILRILSNMKYYLSTAKAKFIFIAGREMYDIHLADVSERNNYIGSIFNVVILVPSFLTDHHTGKKTILQESTIASLPEEFVCRRLFPHDYPVEFYDLKNYRIYLEKEIFHSENNRNDEYVRQEKIQKVIAVVQQFIIYLAHLSKGAPKKMIQLFESFVEIHIDDDIHNKNTLFVKRYNSSRHFLSFNYYKQYTLGIVAYLITPIFYRLAESNIKELSDKLLVSSLRFVDFLFKFHKHSFSWKHLDMSPEMLEVNRAPELKSVVVDLLNYLTQVHINKSNFSLSEYKFDGLIANEIFAMAKTDEVFSALFSFSLDETLPLKKHYQDLLENAKKEYQREYKGKTKTPVFIDAVSSLQSVLGDLHYYDDELEEAETFYKSSVHALRNDEDNNDNKRITLDQLYIYIRNMLRLGIIYEKRKQYDFAYLTYGELCKRIIQERNIDFSKAKIGVELREEANNEYKKNKEYVFVKASSAYYMSTDEKNYYDNIEFREKGHYEEKTENQVASLQPLYFQDITPKTNDLLFKKMTFEGLKMLYLPFIAKLQILEQSHMGGISYNHLEQLDKELELLTFIIDHEESKLLEAEFCSRLADILYYKNADLKYKKNENRKDDEIKCSDEKNRKTSDSKGQARNESCTACYYYHKSLSILLDKTTLNKKENRDKNTLVKLLITGVEQLNDENKQVNGNYSMKFFTILARILSDWGNVFFSCDVDKTGENVKHDSECYICDKEKCNTVSKSYSNVILDNCIKYLDSEKETWKSLSREIEQLKNKKDISFAMYSISSIAYRRAGIYKRSSFQIYKMLCLVKDYKCYNHINLKRHINQLSKQAIHYLWYANEDLNLLELNKRKKDFKKVTTKKKDKIPLQYLLVDNEITRIRVLVKELKLKIDLTYGKLKKYYNLYITSPYKINYSIVGRIYRLRLKTKVNYEAYQMLLANAEIKNRKDKDFTLKKKDFDYFINKSSERIAKDIFEDFFESKDDKAASVAIFENIIAESIYSLIDIAQLSETMDETYLFPHSFLGTVHEHLSFWIRQYEEYEKYKNKIDFINEYNCKSNIENYLKQYLDEEWREQLSGYRENQRALLHYYKCLEIHNEGRAYHNMIDTMCYLRDDFNDRSDHFNIAEERHLIVNGKINDKINAIKDIYKGSKLYKVKNYFKND